MMKFREKDTFESQDRPKTKSLVPVSQVKNAKKKSWKEIKSVIFVNIQMIKKQSRLIVVMEIVLVVWIDQTNHTFP